MSTTPLPTPPLPTPSLHQLRQTFGVLFDGLTVSMIGYGFTFYQTYVYFSKYPADHWGLKTFVTAIFALDTVSSALLSKALYFYMVSSLPYFGGLTEIHPNFTEHILFSTLTVLAAHLFVSARLWNMSRNIWVTDIPIFFSIATFALGIAMTAIMFNDTALSTFASLRFKLALSLACVCAALTSLSTLIGLNRYSSKPTHLKPVLSPEWFDGVATALFARGLLAVVIQLVCLITYVSRPHKIYWIPLYFAGAKVIINSPLYMLNSRARVRGKGINEEDTIQRSTGPGFMSSTGTATLSDMFKAAPASQVVNISRTVEFDRETDADLAKSGYASDHGHPAQRSFEDGQKHAEVF